MIVDADLEEKFGICNLLAQKALDGNPWGHWPSGGY